MQGIDNAAQARQGHALPSKFPQPGLFHGRDDTVQAVALEEHVLQRQNSTVSAMCIQHRACCQAPGIAMLRIGMGLATRILTHIS